MYYAEFIKNLRKDKGLTQIELSEILEVSAQAIKKIENGMTIFPSPKMLERISDYVDDFKISVASAIIFGEDDFTSDEMGFVGNRYLAYKYINGWNIDDAPVEMNYRSELLMFSGKISKRREPKNSSLVFEITEFNLNPYLDISDDEAFDILLAIITVVMQSPMHFRKIEIIFNVFEYSEEVAFEVMSKIKIYKLAIDISLVLFDPIMGAVVQVKNLRVKEK